MECWLLFPGICWIFFIGLARFWPRISGRYGANRSPRLYAVIVSDFAGTKAYPPSDTDFTDIDHGIFGFQRYWILINSLDGYFLNCGYPVFPSNSNSWYFVIWTRYRANRVGWWRWFWPNSGDALSSSNQTTIWYFYLLYFLEMLIGYTIKSRNLAVQLGTFPPWVPLYYLTNWRDFGPKSYIWPD